MLAESVKALDAAPLRILHLEDDANDRHLVAATLLRGGLHCDLVYAANEREFRDALNEHDFDLILSDFTLPSFSGAESLVIALELRPQTPFVYLSGTIGEERAVECLKSGATDYVIKDHLTRLVEVIRRALREARERAERIRNQNQLALFRSLLDNSNDVIEVIDPESGRFLDVNQRALQTHGYTREEYLSLRLPDIAPALAGQPWEEVKVRVRHSTPGLIESWHRRKDGSLFPVEVSSAYVRLDREYLLAVVRDISDRKKAEEAMHLSEQKFRELAETIEEVFWMSDPSKNQILYVSPGYEKIWGRTCESLYAAPQTWLDAIHEDDRERILHAATTRQIDGTYNEIYRIVHADGKVRWIRDRAFPLRNAAGQVDRIVGVAHDITESKRLEEQFRQSQKMEAIGQLAAGVAHDFNNILGVMLLQADLLGSQKDTPAAVQDGLKEIRAAGERAAHLTRQLLLFSRKQVMQPRDLDVNEVVTGLAKMLQRIIGEDVRLGLHLRPTPLIAHADAGMLEQVLMNLAVNSRDAMPGGGRLLIATAEMVADTEFVKSNPEAVPGRYIVLSVSDSGGGIPPEILPRIFEPFFTTKEAGKGTGLGLATVFGIAKQHRGFVTVESEFGQGAKFQVFLPATVASPGALQSPREQNEPCRGTETILVVEDEATLRSLLRAKLERHGYHVLEAGNGRDALTLWEEHRASVALLLTDLVMPGRMTGLELARKMQKDNPNLKVVFSSGYSAEVSLAGLHLKQDQNFLQKPYQPDQLLKIIRHSLDEAEGGPSSP